MRIAVIGSGFGGLSAAIRLGAQGHDVTIFEKRDRPGGRASAHVQDGYTFDAGPTAIAAPWLIQELFDVAGKRTADYVTLVPLDPFYCVRFEDGGCFRYSGQRDHIVREIRTFNPGDVAGYNRLSKAASAILDAALPLMSRPFDRLLDGARVMPALVRARAYRSVASLVNRYVGDKRLRRVFSVHPLLVGRNPYRAMGLYGPIDTIEQRWGLWFAMGGIGALVGALVRLHTEAGGSIRLNAEVSGIALDERTRRATGLRLASGEEVAADIVVSDADVAHTYRDLVPARFRKVETDRRIARRAYSPSVFVLHFGTNRRHDDFAHLEILVGERFRELVDDVFARKRLPSDFVLYLHRPTATDPSLAPAGCDAWHVVAPVPHLGGDTDWHRAARPYRDAIVRHLEERYLPGLSREIVTERCIDPRYFRDTLNSHLGSAFSVEPTVAQSVWRRPHNRSQDVPNLYCVGAGTHPGAGVPGVITSGAIVARMIGNG